MSWPQGGYEAGDQEPPGIHNGIPTRKPAFYQPISEERPWGVEEIVALVPGVATLKILRMRAGTKGRLQRHHFKNEAGYVMKGTLIIRYVDSEGLREGELHAGDSFWFPPGTIHQEEAKTDCTILEISTPHKDDREGMEAFFNLSVPADALPSTKPKDVEVWKPWF